MDDGYFLRLIESKRDGASLDQALVQRAVADITRGIIPDYQVAAWLMAIFFRGLDPDETVALTLAMRDSGRVLQFPRDSRPVVDKHSTGGVGDKVSLPLTPLLACLGFRVPMVSGRGLGITGGTLDKLESIPGFSIDRSPQQIVEQVQEIGAVFCGQTEEMVPADKILYSLRDVTGTVPSIPLITSSILSKKLAESLEALVLDVKFGRAAFMRDASQARELAITLVRLAKKCGLKAIALVTAMDTPLGSAVGNFLEVEEAMQCLQGGAEDDLRELVLECAAQLLLLTGRESDRSLALKKAAEPLDSGQAWEKWLSIVRYQGGRVEALQNGNNARAPFITDIPSDRKGYVTDCDGRLLGELVRDLGGGRATRDSVIDHRVGVDRLVQVGERVEAGQPLGRLHAASQENAIRAAKLFRQAVVIGEAKPPQNRRISEIIT